MKEMWRVPDEFLEQAQNDATIIAIRDMERPASTSSLTAKCAARAIRTAFATALEESTLSILALSWRARGRKRRWPRVVGKVRRAGPVEVRDMQFLRPQHRAHRQITLPGPFTMSQQAKDEFYNDAEAFGDGHGCSRQRGGA